MRELGREDEHSETSYSHFPWYPTARRSIAARASEEALPPFSPSPSSHLSLNSSSAHSYASSPRTSNPVEASSPASSTLPSLPTPPSPSCKRVHPRLQPRLSKVHTLTWCLGVLALLCDQPTNSSGTRYQARRREGKHASPSEESLPTRRRASLPGFQARVVGCASLSLGKGHKGEV